ncbi:YrhK family protein [Alkalicoccobacillus plakortidis]|uniref:YrhK family protein n=1 Tax=Alkalicoccobacillus plakortidis TaxID=444060 RepID=A0ABT0XG90_9BACI|nr:YrhK family protein [Alkalicoccobacillus plakortidis]MCM2674926.1 YrhK family protein [Alkalicoccobacillus plakortidis]
MLSKKEEQDYIDLQAGRFRLYFRKRYQLITTVNDLLIGFFFVVGSILNFFSSIEMVGNSLYLCGSLLLASRPVLRIMHDASLRNEMKHSRNYNPTKYQEDEKTTS